MKRLFSFGGTALPDQALLVAKILAICWLLPGHAFFMPGVFLPFVPALDALHGVAAISPLLIGSGLLAIFAIVSGRAPRAGCLLLAAVIAFATLGSRVYFSNNRVFFTCALVLVALQRRGGSPLLMRLQLALLYLGAGLDKALTADWRSGTFIDSLARGLKAHGNLWLPGNREGGGNLLIDAFLAVSSALPPLGLAQLVSLVVIAAELFLALTFAFGWMSPAIGVHLLLQAGIALFLGSTMGVFVQACCAVTLLFARWPASLRVTIDPTSGAHRAARSLVQRLDADAPRSFEQRRGGALTVELDGRVLTGARAWHALLVSTRGTYLVVAALASSPFFLPWMAPLLLAALSFRREVLASEATTGTPTSR